MSNDLPVAVLPETGVCSATLNEVAPGSLCCEGAAPDAKEPCCDRRVEQRSSPCCAGAKSDSANLRVAAQTCC
jgi:hypothetical protein